jgi:predicted DNA-binding transcriptional regulator AlpA
MNQGVTLVNANDLAKLLSVSVRHVWRMKAMRKLPDTVSVGGCVRWLMGDIQLFLELGCPDGQKFKALKAAGKRGC